MAYNVGAGTSVQIGKESAYGTAVAGASVLNFTSESLKATPKIVEEDNLLDSKADGLGIIAGISGGGSTGLAFRPEFMGFLIKATLGGTDTVTQNDGGVTGYHKHSIVTQTSSSSLPSYTLIVDRKTAVKKYSGCKVDSLDLSAKMGALVTGSINWKCKDESSGALTGLSNPVLQPYVLTGGVFTLDGTAYDLSGASIKVSNNLIEMPQTLGTGLYNSEPVHSKRSISIEWEQAYDANIETLYNTNLMTSTVIGTVILTTTSGSMVTGTSPYKVTFTLNNVRIESIDRNISGSGVITAKVTAKATLVGSTEPITVSVWDAQSSAY